MATQDNDMYREAHGAETLARNWWAVMLRGVAAIVFGLLTLIAPALSLAALVLLFGAYALVDGVLAVVSAVRRTRRGHWAMLLFEGLVGIAAGVLTMLWPGITAVTLLYLIAAWAVVTGVLEIAAAVRLRKAIHNEWLLALGGIVSVALGVLLFLRPATGALALVLWIGAYALVDGILLVAAAFRLHAWAREHGVREAYTPA